VLHKAADKLLGLDGHLAPLLLWVFVSEGHLVIFEAYDALVADSDPEDIGREVFECGFALTHRLDVDDPFSAPYFCRDLFEQVGVFLDCITEPGAHDFGDCFFGHEVLALCSQPAFTIIRDATARYDEVSVQMEAHVAFPCLCDTEEADLTADPLWVACELLDGFGSGAHQ